MSPSSGDATKMTNDIKKYDLGGIVLFGEDFNNQNADSMKQKDRNFQNASKYGLFISNDQEGGTVSRLSTSPELTNGRNFPSPQEVYKQSGITGVVKGYSSVAKTLRSLGINWNFIPVADVSDDLNIFIYDRTLG